MFLARYRSRRKNNKNNCGYCKYEKKKICYIKTTHTWTVVNSRLSQSNWYCVKVILWRSVLFAIWLSYQISKSHTCLRAQFFIFLYHIISPHQFMYLLAMLNNKSSKNNFQFTLRVHLPSGKRSELYWIRGSMTVTTWTEEAEAMSKRAASLTRQSDWESREGLT